MFHSSWIQYDDGKHFETNVCFHFYVLHVNIVAYWTIKIDGAQLVYHVNNH